MARNCSPRVLVDQDSFRPNDFFVHKQVTQAPASPLAALGGLLDSTSPCLPVTSPAAFPACMAVDPFLPDGALTSPGNVKWMPGAGRLERQQLPLGLGHVYIAGRRGDLWLPHTQRLGAHLLALPRPWRARASLLGQWTGFSGAWVRMCTARPLAPGAPRLRGRVEVGLCSLLFRVLRLCAHERGPAMDLARLACSVG